MSTYSNKPPEFGVFSVDTIREAFDHTFGVNPRLVLHTCGPFPAPEDYYGAVVGCPNCPRNYESRDGKWVEAA